MLKDGGKIIFKTDNRELFDFSVEELSVHPSFDVISLTYDLHNSGIENNIVTEYESKFMSMGLPIHRLIAVKNSPK